MIDLNRFVEFRRDPSDGCIIGVINYHSITLFGCILYSGTSRLKTSTTPESYGKSYFSEGITREEVERMLGIEKRITEQHTVKDATITVHLEAESGYVADMNARISADQWGRICAIIAETKPE